MSNSILTMKKLFNKLITSSELPSYQKEMKNLKNVQERLRQEYLREQESQKFYRENLNAALPWDFELIVTKAFNNKGQKGGDKNKLDGGGGCPFKQFSSI
jgi:hypothetical protein